MHPEAMDYVRTALTVVGGPTNKHILEIGSLNINGGVRALCANAASYTGIDKVAGPGVDIVTDVRAYTPTTLVDLIICTEVLEHDPQPRDVLRCATYYLRTDGYLILTCASTGRKPHSAYGAEHPEPGEYYGNVAPDELRAMLDPLWWEIIDLNYLATPGDVRLIARRIHA